MPFSPGQTTPRSIQVSYQSEGAPRGQGAERGRERSVDQALRPHLQTAAAGPTGEGAHAEAAETPMARAAAGAIGVEWSLTEDEFRELDYRDGQRAARSTRRGSRVVIGERRGLATCGSESPACGGVWRRLASCGSESPAFGERREGDLQNRNFSGFEWILGQVDFPWNGVFP